MEIPPLPSTNPNKPLDFFEQYRWPILAGLVVMLTIGIYLVFTPPRTQLGTSPDVMIAGEAIAKSDKTTNTEVSGQLVIDVAGAVVHPGVFRIDHGSIVEDAINAAGGFARTADLDAVARQINRAEELTNHSKVYVPKKGDIVMLPAPTSNSPVATGPIAGSQTKININTADNAELELLPTIGPVMAQRIIDYRLQNGAFTSLEQIQDVNGISEAKFAQLKDLITI